jgi:hypothetical protein
MHRPAAGTGKPAVQVPVGDLKFQFTRFQEKPYRRNYPDPAHQIPFDMHYNTLIWFGSCASAPRFIVPMQRFVRIVRLLASFCTISTQFLMIRSALNVTTTDRSLGNYVNKLAGSGIMEASASTGGGDRWRPGEHDQARQFSAKPD